MKSRTVAFLLGALVLLVLVALLAERSEKTRRESQLGGGKLLAGFAADAAVKLEVTAERKTQALEKKEGKWRVLPGGQAADETAVGEALAKLEAIDKRELASRNQEKHALLQVDEGNADAIEVRVWTRAQGDPTGDPTHEVLIGKTGSDYRSSYVRLAGQDEVYLSQDSVRGAFERGRRGWRDLQILEFDADQVRRLEVKTDEGGFTAERVEQKAKGEGAEPKDADAGKWQIVAPEEAPANDAAIDAILDMLSHLAGDEETDETDLEKAGLATGTRSSKVTLEDGRALEVWWGNESDGKVLVRKADDPTLYALFSYRKNSVLKNVEDVKEREPGAPPPLEDLGEPHEDED